MSDKYSITIDGNVLISKITSTPNNPKSQVCIPLGIKPISIIVTIENISEETVLDVIQEKIKQTESIWLN